LCNGIVFTAFGNKKLKNKALNCQINIKKRVPAFFRTFRFFGQSPQNDTKGNACHSERFSSPSFPRCRFGWCLSHLFGSRKLTASDFLFFPHLRFGSRKLTVSVFSLQNLLDSSGRALRMTQREMFVILNAFPHLHSLAVASVGAFRTCSVLEN